MNFEELQELFRIAMNEHRIYRPRADNHDRPIANYRHVIYPFRSLEQLIDRLREIAPDDWDEDDDNLVRFSARFVMEDDGTLWFAREGTTGYSVPNHVQMHDRCIAAGRITFSRDYQTIIGISNQSGHFMPQTSCVPWVIAALLHVNAPLGELVTIGLCDAENRLVEGQFTPENLQALIPRDMIEIELMPRINQPQRELLVREPRVMIEENRPFRRQRVDAFDLNERQNFPLAAVGLFRPEPRRINDLFAAAPPVTP